MKFLKVLLIILGALVVILVLMSLVGPKTYVVERSAVISASPDVVWPYTSSGKAFQEWSPFRKMDTTAVVEYFGDDGTVGSGYRWKGKKSGKGESTFTTLEPGKTAVNHLLFYTPFGKMESDAYMNLEPDPGGTKITWGLKGTNNFIQRVMGVMMNMEKQMSPVFDEGLADLQALIASRAAAVPTTGYQITTGDYAGGKYLAVRGDVKMTEIANFYDKNIPLLMAEVDKSKLEMTGVPSGIYYTWDEKSGMSNMAVVIPVKGDVKAPAGMEVITLPAGRSLGMDYLGGYSKLPDAHMALDAHMRNNNIEYVGPVLEEYYVGPGTEPDSNKWVTKITYLVK